MNKPVLAAVGFLFAFLPAAVAIAAEGTGPNENPPPMNIIVSCQRCHGPGGNSSPGAVPRLNGQQAEYIIRRLNNFLDPTREDPHAIKTMWGVASKLDSSTFASLAAYFSRQTPTTSSGGRGKLASEGRKIYMNGAAAQHVPACNACHGLHAEGSGATPRLAGQHAVYLTNQLERLSFSLRVSDIMHPNLYRITEQQIKALVAYLAAK